MPTAEQERKNANNRAYRMRKANRDWDAFVPADLQATATASPGKGYIDARRFTALFSRNANNRNRRLIAEGIYLIARNFVRRYQSKMPAIWCEDAASEAALLGLEKIWHYQIHCQHKNAFSYFTKLVQNKVKERLRVESRLQQGLSPWGRT